MEEKETHKMEENNKKKNKKKRTKYHKLAAWYTPEQSCKVIERLPPVDISTVHDILYLHPVSFAWYEIMLM